MVSKIKIRIKAENANINLPSIPVSWLPFFLKLAARSQMSHRHEDKQSHDVDHRKHEIDLTSTMHQVSSLIKEAKPLLRNMDPFVLVEVQSEDTYVLIEMR